MEAITAEIASVRSYRDHGKALTLIVCIGHNRFADVDAVIEGADLTTFSGFSGCSSEAWTWHPDAVTARGDWQIPKDSSRLILQIRQIGLNLEEIGPVSRWRNVSTAC